MSTLLALDCSTEYCSVAVLTARAVVARDVHAVHDHALQLIGHANALLDEAGVALSDCEAIAFGAGPGSFTGLRVACAVAQGMAFGSNCPVVPVGTLAALAQAARLQHRAWPSDCLVLCAQDARMGEAYWSLMRWHDGQWSERVAARLSRPEEIAALLDEDVFCGCGSALRVFAPVLAGLVGEVIDLDHPGAVAIATLATEVLDRGLGVSAAAAHPLYVRERVALTSAERSAREGRAS